MSELILVKNEALYAVNNLRKWMQPQRVERNLVKQHERLHIFAIIRKLPFKHSVRLQQTAALFCQRRLEFSENVAGCVVFSLWLEQSTSLDECQVVSEPLGLVFIMGSWCSPIQLCLVPLVGAIAAGDVQTLSRISWFWAMFLHQACMFLLYLC